MVSFDLLHLATPVDELLEDFKKDDPGANRANVIRTLIVEALRARKKIK